MFELSLLCNLRTSRTCELEGTEEIRRESTPVDTTGYFSRYGGRLAADSGQTPVTVFLPSAMFLDVSDARQLSCVRRQENMNT